MSPFVDALFRHHKIASYTVFRSARRAAFALVLTVVETTGVGCSHDRSPAPPARSAAAPPRPPRTAEVETPKRIETATSYHASLGHGAELWLPPWFEVKRGGYDLIVHFHG